MTIAEIMTKNVTVIRPEDSVQEACAKMRDEDIGFLPVCDGETIVGAITDRDIATRVMGSRHKAESRTAESCLVRDAMSCELVLVYEDQEILEAARLMEVKQIRRLMVVNRAKKLVGVLTLGDISRHAPDHHLAVEILERVSEPAWQQFGP